MIEVVVFTVVVDMDHTQALLDILMSLELLVIVIMSLSCDESDVSFKTQRRRWCVWYYVKHLKAAIAPPFRGQVHCFIPDS